MPHNVKLLLERGADTHLKNKDGQTTLMLARLNDRKDIARLLKQAGVKE